MSMQNHLSELQRRHHALDEEIAREKLRPSADDGRMSELKRRKLSLKDEIARLRTDRTVH